MGPLAIGMKLILVFAIICLLSLQALSVLPSSFIWGTNIEKLAFAQVSGNKPITQRLGYAHFLPLTNNSKSHQVKIIVNYSPIVNMHI